VIRAYGNNPEGKEIVDLWHAANKKDKSKSKSKDNANSGASRRMGRFIPSTNTDFKQDIGVDTLPDLPDCPKNFEYSKRFLLERAMTKVPSEMQRMHNWYMRACRLGLRTLCALYHP
jgi:hypothetical protein